MELITDGLLLAASLAAALYCRVLAAKLRRFTALETGMGGAIAVLSAQVDEMKAALERARATAGGAEARLQALCAKGEASAGRLELLTAALHDLTASQTDLAPERRAPASPAVAMRRAPAQQNDHIVPPPSSLPGSAARRPMRVFRRRHKLAAVE